MTSRAKIQSRGELLRKIATLETELAELRETFEAIRNGQVDALVVAGANGDQIFTLKNADQPYRVLVETMSEGAVTLGSDGSIIYCNDCFAGFVGVPLENTIGASILEFICDKDIPAFKQLMATAKKERCRGEIGLLYVSGNPRPALFSMSAIQLDADEGISIVITDMTEQRNLAKVKEDIERLKFISHNAQQAIAERDEFLTIASHELKTPITSLKLQLEIAAFKVDVKENRAPTPEKLVGIFSVCMRQVSQLTKLVEDLLDVSRMRAGQIVYVYEKVNLGELLNGVISRTKEQLAGNNNALSINIPKDIFGTWDRFRIDQVFSNLLSNVIKYSPGSVVEINATIAKNVVSITFRDYGPGIPKQRQEAIFDRFGRGMSCRNISGLGLGLFIARNILEAHSGQILVASDEGHGAIFTLMLPLDFHAATALSIVPKPA